MTKLEEALTEIGERATSATTTSLAARAMADALVDVAARYLGGDAVMSGTGRAVTAEPDAQDGAAAVTPGGAWGLADGGRRVARPARARAGRHALATPWGPRAAVKGSTWRGLGIGDRAADAIFDAGAAAITRSLER